MTIRGRSRRRRIGVAALAVALLLAACTGPSGTTSVSPGAPSISASASLQPIEWDGAAGIEGVQAYAAEIPDVYAGMYIDPPGTDSLVLLVTDDPANHAIVAAIHPDTRIRQVAHSMAELQAIIDEFDWESLQAQGAEPLVGGVDDKRNRAYVELKSNDPTLALRLEAAYDGMLDVTVHPHPGPWAHVDAGEGWRLLGVGQASAMEAYAVHAARSVEAAEHLWERLAIVEDLPPIDWAAEVVVFFAHGISQSCPEVRLDGVTIVDGVVFSVTSDPLTPRNCTSDLSGAATFAVALSRDALPAEAFTLRLDPDSRACDDCGFNREIDVELP